jgi:hypothetical protein
MISMNDITFNVIVLTITIQCDEDIHKLFIHHAITSVFTNYYCVLNAITTTEVFHDLHYTNTGVAANLAELWYGPSSG